MKAQSHDEVKITLPAGHPLAFQGFAEQGRSGYLQRILSEGTISLQLAVQQNNVAEQPALKFMRLLAEWKRNTRYVSSFRRIVLEPSYQKIIMMGEDALPFIFQELKNRGGHWFWALKIITGEDIGNPEDDFETVRTGWLKWGREHGYL